MSTTAERPPLGLARFRWGPTESVPDFPRDGWRGPISALIERARVISVGRDGAIFRELRERLQLELPDCAAGWGVTRAEVEAVERGGRRFAATDDLWAALQQLWLWHIERRQQKLATPTGGTWDGTERDS